MKRRDPEGEIQRTIIEYMRSVVAAPMILHSIPNEGIYTDSMLARLIANGMKVGAADLIASINGRTYYIEVKDRTGKQKPKQKDFEAECAAACVPYGIARSVEDVRSLLVEWGVPTREVGVRL